MKKNNQPSRDELLREIRVLRHERDNAVANAQRLELLVLLLDSIPHNVFGKDLEGRFNFANRQYCETIGHSLEALLGKTDFDVHPAEQAEKYRNDDKEVMTSGEPINQIEKFTRLDGSSKFIRVIKAPVIGPEGTAGILGTFWDVTERIEAMHELAKATKQAQEANSAKSEFLSVMSHEIRTPMNTVLGMAELLYESGLTDDQLEMLQALQRAGNHLIMLIEDILDITRIEAGKIELLQEPIDLQDLVESCISVLKPLADKKKLRLEVTPDAAVDQIIVCDATRLRQIMLNLLGNAVKFTDEGEVIIHVTPQDDDGTISILVTDTGIGLPSNMLEEVFKPFTQLDTSNTREHSGVGLGLAISRKLAAIMRGTVTLHPAADKGTVATLTIPATPI